METTPRKYQQYVRQKQRKSPLAKDLTLAFLVGGLICTLGQGLTELYASALDKQSAATAGGWVRYWGALRLFRVRRYVLGQSHKPQPRRTLFASLLEGLPREIGQLLWLC